MLTDLPNSFVIVLSNKFVITKSPLKTVSHLEVLLHYLVKYLIPFFD